MHFSKINIDRATNVTNFLLQNKKILTSFLSIISVLNFNLFNNNKLHRAEITL